MLRPVLTAQDSPIKSRRRTPFRSNPRTSLARVLKDGLPNAKKPVMRVLPAKAFLKATQTPKGGSILSFRLLPARVTSITKKLLAAAEPSPTIIDPQSLVPLAVPTQSFDFLRVMQLLPVFQGYYAHTKTTELAVAELRPKIEESDSETESIAPLLPPVSILTLECSSDEEDVFGLVAIPLRPLKYRPASPLSVFSDRFDRDLGEGVPTDATLIFDEPVKLGRSFDEDSEEDVVDARVALMRAVMM